MSAAGHAYVVDDRREVERLWSPAASAFFEGPHDPRVVALRIELDQFSWWTSADNKLVRVVNVVRSMVGAGNRAVEHGDEHL